MAYEEFILALDQGTTGSRSMAFGGIKRGTKIVGQAYEEFTQILPQPGWVEHDAEEIWGSVQRVISKVGEGKWQKIATAIGITNQAAKPRWCGLQKTHRPIHQCHRVAGSAERKRRCRQLQSESGSNPCLPQYGDW